jgi:hypothetical protein
MNLLKNAALCCGLIVPALSFAQAPSGAPAGTTGLCKDGSYSSAPSKRGACAGHKGVKDWYAADAAAPATPAPVAAASTPAPAAAPAPAATPMAKAATPAATSTSTTAATKTPAPGGGPGQVWVNTSSKVYHCQGSKYYGTTKAGEYMTEAAAKAAGAHADHGKACTS